MIRKGPGQGNDSRGRVKKKNAQIQDPLLAGVDNLGNNQSWGAVPTSEDRSRTPVVNKGFCAGSRKGLGQDSDGEGGEENSKQEAQK